MNKQPTISERERAKRMYYIRNTGYGPCSQFTLREWLEAKDFYKDNISLCKSATGGSVA